MGDRGNIVVKSSDAEQVWLYSHWNGTGLPRILQQALRDGRDRWTDAQYLTRIIFCRMVPIDAIGGTTGFGISCSIHDNEHDISVVDTANQRVFIIPESELVDWRVPNGYKPKKSEQWTLQEYCERQIAEE